MVKHSVSVGGLKTALIEADPALDWGIYAPDSEIIGYNSFAEWEAAVGKVIPIKPLYCYIQPYTFIHFDSRPGGRDPQSLFNTWIGQGSMPLLMMHMFDPTGGSITTEFKKFLPHTFTDGDHDAVLTDIAEHIAAWGKTMWLRIWWEANNTLQMPCMPWAAVITDEDTSPLSDVADWVAGWKYIHDLFVSEGATNVKWFWSMLAYPSASYGSAANPVTMAELYPGDSYVDAIGTEFYTGAGLIGSELNPYLVENCRGAYNEICAVTANRPVWVAEFAAAAVVGHADYKPLFIHNCLSASNLQTYFPRVEALMIWDSGDALDFWETPESKAAAVNAFMDGLYKDGY